jgi:hypothetical protein
MAWWDVLLDIPKKPASMWAGFQSGLGKGLGRITGGNEDPENRLGYSNPLSGLIAGAKGNLSYTGTQRALQGKYEPVKGGAKWIGAGLDTLADPVLFLPGAGGAMKGIEAGRLGTGLAEAAKTSGIFQKAKPLVEAAGSLERLEKGSGAAKTGAQFGRRALTGTALTGSLPAGLGYAAAGRWIEPTAAKVGSKVLGGAARSTAVENLVKKFGGNAEQAGEAAGKTVARSALPTKRRIPGESELEKQLRASIDQANAQKARVANLPPINTAEQTNIFDALSEQEQRAAAQAAAIRPENPSQAMLWDVPPNTGKAPVAAKVTSKGAKNRLDELLRSSGIPGTPSQQEYENMISQAGYRGIIAQNVLARLLAGG